MFRNFGWILEGVGVFLALAFQPVDQLLQFGNAAGGVEQFDQFLPDKGRGNGMVAAAFEFRQAMTVITGHRPDTAARQIGQQTDCDFMGTDDLEGKWFGRAVPAMEVLQKRRFKAGKVDHQRAGVPMTGRGRFCGSRPQVMPDRI